MAKNYRLTDTVSIANGNTVSTSLALEGSRIVLALVTPAALTSTAVTFQGSIDNSTFNPLYDEGTQYSVNVGTSRFVALKRQVFDAVRYVKVVGGSTEGGTRTINVVSAE